MQDLAFERETWLRVGELSARITSESPNGPPASVPLESRAFLVEPGGRSDLNIRLDWGDTRVSPSTQLAFDSGGTWKLHREGQRDCLRFWAGDPGASAPFALARLELERADAEILLDRRAFPEGNAVASVQYPLDEVLWIHLLAQGLGAELHGCGVVTGDGRGYLFVGQSGDGKSTTARLWKEKRGARILSDDRIILRRIDGRFRMYGTPWHGDARLSANSSAPIDAIFVIGHGMKNFLEPLPVSRSTALLAARAFFPLHDRKGLEWSLQFLCHLTAQVQCFRFEFLPDEYALDFLQTFLAKSEGLGGRDASTSVNRTPVEGGLSLINPALVNFRN